MKFFSPMIAPSILSADFGRLAQDVKAVEKAGADLIHLDVMDGHFVPNITFGPMVVEAVRKATTLPLDVHLMIENPQAYIPAFAKAGADNLTVHAETCPHLHRTIQHIREAGSSFKPRRNISASVSINPATPISILEEILPEVDMILIMTVNPGFGAQKFIPSSIRKIKDLKKIIQERGSKQKSIKNVMIQVDGGVTVENIKEIYQAGADVFVAGNTIFKSKDYKKTIQAMRAQLK
jgi:ribulose-phosphate 3-epimerase